jgi:hypothetical protein
MHSLASCIKQLLGAPDLGELGKQLYFVERMPVLHQPITETTDADVTAIQAAIERLRPGSTCSPWAVRFMCESWRTTSQQLPLPCDEKAAASNPSA